MQSRVCPQDGLALRAILSFAVHNEPTIGASALGTVANPIGQGTKEMVAVPPGAKPLKLLLDVSPTCPTRRGRLAVRFSAYQIANYVGWLNRLLQ